MLITEVLLLLKQKNKKGFGLKKLFLKKLQKLFCHNLLQLINILFVYLLIKQLFWF